MSRRRRNSSSKSISPEKKASGKLKGLWWKVLLGIFAIIIVGGVVAYNKVIAFLHSDGFREEVAELVSAELGAEGELGKFSWSGLSGKNENFTATGGGFIESVNAEDISFDVDLNYIKRDKFKISDISITSVSAEVDARRPFEKTELVKKDKGFLEKLLPEEVEVLDAKIHDFNAKVMTELGEFQASDISVSFKKDQDAYKTVLENGRFELPFSFLTEASLEEGKLVQLDDEIYIEDMKLNIFTSGEVILNGELDLSPRSNKIYDVDGVLTGLKVSDVFPKTWHQYLKGDVKGEFNIIPKSGMEPKISGHIEVLDGQLRALPILDTLAKYFSRDYQTINFEKFECDVSKYKDKYEIKNLKLVSKGLIQLEGDLNIYGVNVDGVFDVGMPSENLSKLPGARGNVFKRGKDGLYWTSIKIGGSFGNITSDIKDRLIQAAIDSGIKDLLNLGEGVVDPKNIEKILNLAVENEVAIKDLPKLLNGEDGLMKGGVEILKSGLGSDVTSKLPLDLLGLGGADDPDEDDEDNPDGLDLPGVEALPLPELPKVPGLPLPF